MNRIITTGRPAVVRAHAEATLNVLDNHLDKCQLCRTATTSRKALCPQGAAAFEEWHIAVSRLTLNGDHT